MGNVIIKIKLMPESLETKLDELKAKAEKIITNNQGQLGKAEQEPIAFGLKALILTFIIPESQDLDPIEQALGKVEGVNSSQVIDMRREFG